MVSGDISSFLFSFVFFWGWGGSFVHPQEIIISTEQKDIPFKIQPGLLRRDSGQLYPPSTPPAGNL
jgi:hypothetical protein